MPYSPAMPSPFRFTLNTSRSDNHHAAQSQKERKLTAPTSLHNAESYNSPSSSARQYAREHKSQQFARTPRFAHPLSTPRVKEHAASPLVFSRTDEGSLGDKQSNGLPGTKRDVFELTNAVPVQNHDRRGTAPERRAELDDEEKLDPGSGNDDDEGFLILASTEHNARTEERDITQQTDSAYTPAAKRRRIGGLAAMDSSAWAPNETTHNAGQPRLPSPPTSPHPNHLPDRTTPTRKKPPIDPHQHHHHQQATTILSTPHFHPPPHFTPLPPTTPLTPLTHSNHARHKYILPPPTPTDQTTAPTLLPDAFSPHRRKERFVPHGWASTLRGWIVDASCSTTSSSDETDGMTIRLEAVNPGAAGAGAGAGGITFLRAAVVGETRRMVNVVLIGEVGGRNGGVVGGLGGQCGGERQKNALSTGTRVQLRAPVWDVWLSAGDDGGREGREGPHGSGEGSVKDDAGGGKIWVICASWRVL